jgi:O-antigen ligase
MNDSALLENNLLADVRPQLGNSFKLWASPKAWLMLFPICFFIVQGHIQTGTVDEKLRLSVQIDTFWGRWGFILLTVFCLAVVLRRYSQLLPKILAVKDLVGFAFLALLSTLWSDLPKRSLLNGVGEIAITLLAIYIVSEFTPDEQMQLIVVPGFFAMVFSIGVVFLAPAIGLDNDEGSPWRGIFAQKNVLGLVTLFLVMPIIHMRTTGTFPKLFRLTYLALASVLIVMSKARTAWIVAVLYLTFVLAMRALRRFSGRDSAILSMLLGLGSSGIAAYVYQNRNSILGFLGKDPTLSERTVIWAAVWAELAKRPLLGYGYAAFWRGLSGASLNVILVSGFLLAQSQNGFLDVCTQMGLVGLLVLLIILLRAVGFAFVCLQLGRDESIIWYCAILVCAFAYSFSESFLADPRHICWFLFMMACIGLRQTAIRLRLQAQSARSAYRLTPASV